MFCPKCGDGLVRQDGDLYCQVGDMYMSPMMETILTEAIKTTPVRSVLLPADGGRSNIGFCPRCQYKLTKLNPDVYALTEQCSQCSFTMTPKMVHGLVELHPHQ